MDVRFTPLPMSLKWVQNNHRFLKAVTFLFLFSHFVFHKMVLFEVTYQTIHQNLVEAHWTLVYDWRMSTSCRAYVALYVLEQKLY